MKLYKKILIIFIVLNIGIVSSVSLFLMTGFQDVVIDNELESKTIEIIEKKQKIESFVESKSEKIKLVSTLAEVQGFLKFIEYGKSDNFNYAEDEWINLLQNQFRNISNTDADLQQIRMFDKEGSELFKLNISDGEFFTSFKSEQLDKDQKYYFDNSLFDDSVSVSNIILNTENGRILSPHTPVMTFVTPVSDGSGVQMGLLVLTYDVSELLSSVEQSSVGNMIMINQDGNIIQHNDKSKIFGKQLGTGFNYFVDFDDLKNSMLKNDFGHTVDDNSLYKVWNKVPHPSQAGKYWVLIYEIKDTELYTPITSIMLNSLYIVGIIMGITTVITWMVSKHVSKPIKLLTERIHKAEKGELNTEIEIKGNDEIAKINLAFNDLVNTLQDSKKTVEQQEIKLKKQLNDLKFLKKSLNESTYFATSDINGNFTYVNERFCKNTQYTSSELIGNNPRILKSGTHDQVFYKKMWDHLLSGRVWIGDINNKRKDGSMYWVKEILIPKKDIDGKVIEFIIIQTDITHQKTNESDLSTSLNYLTKSQELQNEFLETFFKELPIPVDSIRKLCRTLKYDELGDRLNEDQRKNVNAIYENTKKIDFILEEFLGMFKPNSKKETTQN